MSHPKLYLGLYLHHIFGRKGCGGVLWNMAQPMVSERLIKRALFSEISKYLNKTWATSVYNSCENPTT